MQADLGGLLKSKITYGWLIAGIFLEIIAGASIGTTSGVITQGLSDFIYIWSMVVIGIAASAVASESGELADSILSKSVKRYDYILAKFSSRCSYVMIVYLLVVAVLVPLSLKAPNNDYNVYGLISSILFVALALIMLTSLGVALSTVFSNTVVPIVILLILWYTMTFFFPLLDPSLNILSPSHLLSQLPSIVKGIYNGDEWKTAVGFASITIVSISFATIYFSKKDL
jgi:ABC-type transport system involved in multi-copper enzyme maturation permease subunit